MITKPIHTEEKKADYFREFLDKNLPIPDEQPVPHISEDFEETSEEHSVVPFTSEIDENEIENSVLDSEALEEEIRQLPLYEDTFYLLDTDANILIKELTLANIIGNVAFYMLANFTFEVKNSNNLTIIGYDSNKLSLACKDELLKKLIIEQYLLYIQIHSAFESHPNLAIHHKAIKEVILGESSDYETAKKKVMGESTATILKQQNAVVKAMPGLIVKGK